MIRDAPVLIQALTGSLFTWGLTAFGAAGVFLFRHDNRLLLDGSLGFAAGVMTAASFWSLLAPALDVAASQYGSESWASLPVGLGLLAGAAFVYFADVALSHYGMDASADAIIKLSSHRTDDVVSSPNGDTCHRSDGDGYTPDWTGHEKYGGAPSPYDNSDVDSCDSPTRRSPPVQSTAINISNSSNGLQQIDGDTSSAGHLRSRRNVPFNPQDQTLSAADSARNHERSKEQRHQKQQAMKATSWKRMLLLIIAIIVHNVPEGLVVGVGFAAAAAPAAGGDDANTATTMSVLASSTLYSVPTASSSTNDDDAAGAEWDLDGARWSTLGIPRTSTLPTTSATATATTFERARHLAIGIGLQNAPEGLAVSLPLAGAGYSKLTAFAWGQLSGIVEPFAAVLGALAVTWATPLLPYALSFAAGAMLFVVVDDIIPETQQDHSTSNYCDTQNDYHHIDAQKHSMYRTDGPGTTGKGRWGGKMASWMFIVGFLVMMTLDVSLG